MKELELIYARDVHCMKEAHQTTEQILKAQLLRLENLRITHEQVEIIIASL
jgi:hypothetical protein